MKHDSTALPTSGTLPVLSYLQPGQSYPELVAHIATTPQLQAAVTISTSIQSAQSADLAELLRRLQSEVDSLADGSLEGPEKMALMQAKTLDIVFHDLLQSAYANRDNLRFHSLIRLAFRAQAQSARTLETLAVLMKPPVFAQQVNMANQQVVANHPPGAVRKPKGKVRSLPSDSKALPAKTVRLAQKPKSARRKDAAD